MTIKEWFTLQEHLKFLQQAVVEYNSTDVNEIIPNVKNKINNELDRKEEFKEHQFMIDKVKEEDISWHSVDEKPIYGKTVLVAFKVDKKIRYKILDIISNHTYLLFTDDHDVLKWAYIDDCDCMMARLTDETKRIPASGVWYDYNNYIKKENFPNLKDGDAVLVQLYNNGRTLIAVGHFDLNKPGIIIPNQHELAQEGFFISKVLFIPDPMYDIFIIK